MPTVHSKSMPASTRISAQSIQAQHSFSVTRYSITTVDNIALQIVFHISSLLSSLCELFWGSPERPFCAAVDSHFMTEQRAMLVVLCITDAANIGHDRELWE